MAFSLKNSIQLASLLTVFVLLFACSQKEEKKETVEVNDTASCSVKPVNPNGDSELALLMRSMRDTASSFKEMIKAGKVPARFPELFLKIHSAKPTDNETKKPSFDGFADGYLNALKELSHSNQTNVKSNYNSLVQACENCHSEHCPGPLSAIRKLKLP